MPTSVCFLPRLQVCLDALAEQRASRFLSEKEERAHFALWAILKSPLMIAADLRRWAAGVGVSPALQGAPRLMAWRQAFAPLVLRRPAGWHSNLTGCALCMRMPWCSMRPSSLAILKATEVIAINQDPLGHAGDLIWKQGPKEVSGQRTTMRTSSQGAAARLCPKLAACMAGSLVAW